MNDHSDFYQYLPKAKTLQDRQQAEILSLFPQLHLPKCLDFSPIEYKQATAQISKAPDTSNKIHNAPSTRLSEIFAQPVYKSSPKLVVIDNNNIFGQLKAKGKDLAPKQTLIQSETGGQQLEFESRFESGNLAMAAKQSECQYNLLIQKDINTNSCTQWFLFRVRNYSVTGRIRFNILNFTKSYSAFQNGMLPCLFSSRLYTSFKKGWHRGCSDVQYLKNNITRYDKKSFYTLSFVYDFQTPNQQTYFSYCYPYTYTRLQKYLDRIEQTHPKTVYRRRIGQSLSGNYLEMLTITKFGGLKQKPVIFLTARVHPGQTVSSFVCQGFIDFLIGQSKQALLLREQFVFKIIPMLNPDGVINGNYRCSLIGKDLNRCWQTPDKFLHPEIHIAKTMIATSVGQKLAYFDLHGHSKKRSIFVYGCKNKNNPFETKELPYLMHKKLPNFNFYYCNFSMPRVREGTARVALWKQLGIDYCYTLQSSFYGPLKQKQHFLCAQYYQTGCGLARIFYLYFCRKKTPKNVDSIASQQLGDVDTIFKQLYNNNELLTIGDDMSEGSSSAQSLQQTRFPSPARDRPKIQMNQTTTSFLQKRSSLRQKVQEKPLPQVYRPRRIHQAPEIEPYQTSISFNLGIQDFCSHKTTASRIPPILDIKVQTSVPYETRYDRHFYINKAKMFRNSEVVTTQNSNSAIPVPNKIDRSFDMVSIVQPSSMRSQYTNYQRYRRQQFDLAALLFGMKKTTQISQPTQPANKQVYVGNKIGRRISKKQIKSVSKRPPKNLRDRIKNVL